MKRLAAVSVFLLSASGALAADWPTWRFDAARTASSPQELAPELHLQWTRDLAPPILAWPNESRLHFDASYQPVVAGRTVLVASPVDGSLRAFDARSGDERWRFFSEGPMRFAPAIVDDRAMAVSDDGWLYCLGLADGRLRWKVRGAPDDRPDRRQLGNNRLVSFWPARGGPVVAGGTVYFAAGIWPEMGVFVAAVDAASGKLLWRNGDLALIDAVRLDHNNLSQSGLSPQGHLAVRGDMLLVPNGRSMPAALDRATGKLVYYVQGYRNGDCRIATAGNYVFVGDAGVTDVRTGREVGSRWAAAGEEAPATFIHDKVHLFESPIFPYKTVPGCSVRSALVDSMAYGLDRGTFFAYDLGRAAVSEYQQEFVGVKFKPWQWNVPLVWKLDGEDAPRRPAGDAIIRAGGRLYGHWQGKLAAVDLPSSPGGSPRIAWTKPLGGTPGELVAADDRLLVVTREGQIACFGADKVEPKTHARPDAPLAHAPDEATKAAAELLKAARAVEGYCVLMGLGDGRLLEELLRQSKLKLIAVDADQAKVDAWRARLVDARLYGVRAEVFCGRPWEFSLPPYLADLVVCGDGKAAGFSAQLPAAKALDVVRPYGGTACLGVPAAEHEGVARWAASADWANLKCQRTGDLTLVRREGPLAGAARWTHESADPARSFYSTDVLVRPPLGMLWYGDGPDYGFWKHKDYGTGVKPQVIGGRLFAFQIGANVLVAYDVFTGRVLWSHKVDPFTRYASMDDGIYVAGGDRLRVLDPATGEERGAFPYGIGQGRQPFVSDIRVDGDVVLIAAAPQKVRVIEKGLWESTTLVALDRRKGTVLWTREAEHRFNNNALAAGRGRVFAVDSVSSNESDQAQRRGEAPERLPSTVLALNARSGAVLWSKQVDHRHRTYGIGGWTAIRANDDSVAYCPESDLLVTAKQGEATALDAGSGREAWSARLGSAPWVVRGETLVNQAGQVFEVRTGKPTGQSAPPLTRGGCNYMVGNPTMLFLRDRSVCLVDLAAGTKRELFAARSGCSNSLVAADGLLNVPNFSVGCVCNYPVQTAFAMVHMPEAAAWTQRHATQQSLRAEDLLKAAPPRAAR